MAPLLHQGLSHVRVVQMYPRALVHGPLQYGCLDIPHLYTEQILVHARMVLKYGVGSTNPTGFLLHTAAEAMQLEVGFNGKLLAAPLIL